MRGPFFAAATAAALMLASLSVGFLLILSGAIIALVTLRHGAREGLRMIALATSLAVVVRFAVADAQALAMLMLCLLAWLPAWSLALVLGQHQQQAYPLLLAAMLVAGYAGMMRLMVGDVAAFWLARLEPVLQIFAADTGVEFAPEQMTFIARHVHTWTLVAMNTMLVSMVLLGRWWQSALFNPGGFGSEFRELRLPRFATLLAALAATAFVAVQLAGLELEIVSDAFVILVVLFAFQGLAVIHFRARVVSLASAWLGGMYVLLMLMPQIVGPLLATAGVADSVADFRGLRRIAENE